MSDKGRDILIEKMNQGFSELAPDCWEEIRDSLPEEQPEQVEVKRRSVIWRFMPAMAAAVLVLFAFSFIIKDAKTVEKVLYIDVNPSVCISLNRSGNMVSVEGINDDGRRIVSAVSGELAGVKRPEKAAVCIITQMDKEGYFEDGTLDAIISLGYADKDDSPVLNKTGDTIKEYARSRKLKSALVLRSFARDEKVEKAASGMGISAGKYEYIVELAGDGKADDKKIHKLADKTTKEINKYFNKSDKKKSKKTKPEKESEQNVDPDQEPEEEATDKAIGETKQNKGNSSGDKAAKSKKSKKKSVKSNSSAKKKPAKQAKKPKKQTKKQEKAAAGKKGKKAAGKENSKKNDKE